MGIFNDPYEGYGPITPIVRTYGDPAPAVPQPSFLDRLLTALYGEPGAKREFRAFDRKDPAALARLGLAVLRGFPKGIDDFCDAFVKRLELYLAAAEGYGAVLVEDPKVPGTVSEKNPLIVHLAKTGELENLRALGRQLRMLDNVDIWSALDALTGIVMQSVVNSVAGYREKLKNAASVDEFGDLVGRMWGYVSADAILNVVAWRTLDAGARKLGRANVNLAQRKLTQLDLSIEEGYRRSAVSLKVRQKFAEMEKKRLGKEVIGEIVDAADNPPAVAGGRPAPKTLSGSAEALPAGKSPVQKALPGKDYPQLSAGKRNFLLGDREPMPGIPASAPSRSVLIQIVSTKWDRSAIQQIRKNILARPGIPAWTQQLTDEHIYQIATLLDSYHPRNSKITNAQLEQRVSVIAGGIQETVNPLGPEFGQDRALLKTLLAEEGRWDLDSLEYSPRLYTLEPDESARSPVARRAQITDGVWFVHAKDEPLYLFPMLYESKSLSNTNDLFYERVKAFTADTGEAYSVRDPLRAQPYRDIERLSNLDVILEIPINGGTSVRTIYLPAGSIGISKKTTRFNLITPRKAEGLHALNELVSVGFKRSNIIIRGPAYDRKEIEMFARRLLQAPYDKLIPTPKP